MFLGIWSPDAKVNVVSGHRACVETDRGIKKQNIRRFLPSVVHARSGVPIHFGYRPLLFANTMFFSCDRKHPLLLCLKATAPCSWPNSEVICS